MQFKKNLVSVALMGLFGIGSVYAATSVSAYYYDLADPFIADVKKEIDAKAKDFDITIKSFNASDDATAQINQLESASDDKVMLVNLVDRSYGDEVVNSAKAQNKRVIFFNRAPSRSDVGSYANAFFVGENAEEAGKLQGEMILDYIKKNAFDHNNNGKLDLVILKGEISHQETELRTQTVISTLNAQDVSFNRTTTLIADWSYDKAYKLMENYLNKEGLDKVEMVISNNDAMALGALNAMEAFGYDYKTYIPVFGIDAIPDAVESIKAGKMSGTVYNDAKTLSEVLLKLSREKEVLPAKLTEKLGYTVNSDGFVMIPYQKFSLK